MSDGKDEIGVPSSYALPTAEHDAMERVGKALGVDGSALVARARREFLELKLSPASLKPPHQIGAVPQEHRAHYAVVCWWLRRSPALEILAPAALFEEARRAELDEHDMQKVFAASRQLQRIAGDFDHPRSGAARELLLSAIPEPQRSDLAAQLAAARMALVSGTKGRA